MKRAVVNVATGSYVKGQERLLEQCAARGVDYVHFRDTLPLYSPPHAQVPYAFKAWALKAASENRGYETLLWCDACIRFGARPLDDLWEKIERDGVWLANNGYTNYEWTADSAYPDLFPADPPAAARIINQQIPHVVATAFGVSLEHTAGREFLREYLRLAMSKAFCGPWTNCATHPQSMHSHSERCKPCGPSDVRGHRHDQTAASVIAWRLGVKLTECPEWFAYALSETDETCLIADGAY